MENKKGAIALPWEKTVWWIVLFLFVFFMLWFFGGLKDMTLRILKSFLP